MSETSWMTWPDGQPFWGDRSEVSVSVLHSRSTSAASGNDVTSSGPTPGPGHWALNAAPFWGMRG